MRYRFHWGTYISQWQPSKLKGAEEDHKLLRLRAAHHGVSMEAEVRAILGPETQLTYAADWTEYFGYHPQDIVLLLLPIILSEQFLRDGWTDHDETSQG